MSSSNRQPRFLLVRLDEKGDTTAGICTNNQVGEVPVVLWILRTLGWVSHDVELDH